MFLTIPDFRQLIKDDQLAQILPPGMAPLSVGERPDHPVGRLEDVPVLHEGVLTAIAEMSSYLNSRYDVATLFAATATDRHPLIKLYCIDITLYHLHSRISPRAIPQLRMDRYDAAINWLKQVARGELLPDLPTLPNGQDNIAAFNSGRNARTEARL